MPEVWELVDVNKQLTGIRHLRGQEALIPSGHYHLVARVLVMDAKGQILLTQRSHGKAHYPNYWEFGANGSVLAGESSELAACRELWEETGIKVSHHDLVWLEDYRYDNWWLDIYGIVLADQAPALVLDPEENQDWLWLAPDQLEEWQAKLVPGDWERWQAVASKLLALREEVDK